jgi:hypothetical protein
MNQRQFFLVFLGGAAFAGVLFLLATSTSSGVFSSSQSSSASYHLVSDVDVQAITTLETELTEYEAILARRIAAEKLKTREEAKLQFQDHADDADETEPDSKPADSATGTCEKVTRFGLLTVALGPYYVFVRPFVASVDRHLFADDPCVNVTVFIWTDRVSQVEEHRLSADSRVTVMLTPRALASFPEASLKRFHAYLEHESLLRAMDYLWHIDIDAEFIEPVGPELLVDGMFAVAHADSYYYDGTEVAGVKPDGSLLTMADLGVVRPVPARMFQQWVYFDYRRIEVGDPPYDHNHNAAVPMDKAKYYFFGGVWGGRADLVCEAFRTLTQWIDGDQCVRLLLGDARQD